MVHGQLGRTGASIEHLCEEVALKHFFLSDDALSMGALPEFGGAACKALHCAAGFACQLKELRQLLSVTTGMKVSAHTARTIHLFWAVLAASMATI